MGGHSRVLTFNGSPIAIHGVEDSSSWRDFYYFVLVSPWPRILMLLAGLYLLTNVVFAGLYMLGGDCIANATPGSFWDAFFFSVQTWATIGYGAMAPKTRYADVLVAIESFSGLLSMSVVTGLVFSKFAQPKAKVRFTEKILVTKYDGKPTLMFRMGNMRGNQIVEARLMAVWTQEALTAEGVLFRKLQNLKLVRDTTVLFSLSWTVMHEIDETSPLYNMNLKDLEDKKVQIIISMTGLDEEFNQTVHARALYQPRQFVWGHRFEDVLGVDENGMRCVDYRKFDQLVKLDA
jgi:inward rectifier potassium channel